MQQPWDSKAARSIVDDFKTMRGGLLPALHALQDRLGYVDDSVMQDLATAFNLSPADVYGVITFYHDFKRTHPGRHTIKVCRGEACQAMGSEDMLAEIKKRLQVDVGGITADGEFSLDQVFCLGNCALSPAIQVDKKLYGRMSAQRVETLCKGIR
jgi:formate dehydrogenase subunit gamma